MEIKVAAWEYLNLKLYSQSRTTGEALPALKKNTRKGRPLSYLCSKNRPIAKEVGQSAGILSCVHGFSQVAKEMSLFSCVFLVEGMAW